MFGKKKQSVMGHHLPAPRLTPTALRLFLLYAAGPVIGALALVDLVLYFAFRAAGSCYGVWCLF